MPEHRRAQEQHDQHHHEHDQHHREAWSTPSAVAPLSPPLTPPFQDDDDSPLSSASSSTAPSPSRHQHAHFDNYLVKETYRNRTHSETNIVIPSTLDSVLATALSLSTEDLPLRFYKAYHQQHRRRRRRSMTAAPTILEERGGEAPDSAVAAAAGSAKTKPLFVTQLPPEIIESVCLFLDYRDQVKFASASKYLHSVIGREKRWRREIEGSFNMPSLPDFTAWPTIVSSMHHYGLLDATAYLDGLWHSTDDPQGHLLRICLKPNALFAYTISGYESFDRNPQRSVFFALRLKAPADDTTHKGHTLSLTHHAQHISHDKLTATPLDFGNSNLRASFDRVVHFEARRVSDDEFVFRSQGSSSVFRQAISEKRYRRLPTNLLSAPALSPPLSLSSLSGLWVGRYGIHGNEIINVTVNETTPGVPLLVATKITGDPNVPSGKITFCLHKQLPVIVASTMRQYSGEAQIAEVGYEHPEMTDAVLHFFSSSDLAHFVVTWRMLDSSIAFSRLQTPSVYR